MEVVDIASLHADQREQCAQILVDAFVELAPESYETLYDARREIDSMLETGKVALAAVEGGMVLGIIGGQPMYALVWELHPLAVAPTSQRRGVGTALVAALEARVKANGALTLLLGTDDEVGWTSIWGVELYPDPLAHLASIRSIGGHPFAFYQRLGYTLIGVVPDANGLGKPDILMAKRL